MLSKKDLLYFFIIIIIIIYVLLLLLSLSLSATYHTVLTLTPSSMARGGGGTLPWAAGTLEPLAYITTVSQTILC